jgi:hypothetical protein
VVFVALATNVVQKRRRARAEPKITSPIAYSPAKDPLPQPTRSGHISDELVTYAMMPPWTPTPATVHEGRLSPAKVDEERLIRASELA